MALPSIFNENVCNEIIDRINNLSTENKPLWGSMNSTQMLAHCNVSYEMTYENIHPKPNPVLRFILKTFIKNKVVSAKPYKRSERTAPQFMINDTRSFEKEKDRLINYIKKTQQLGESELHLKENVSFGILTSTEWNNMFYKHLDHHLKQFNV